MISFEIRHPQLSGKFKHLKFSENDKFSGTNSIDSILIISILTVPRQFCMSVDEFKSKWVVIKEVLVVISSIRQILQPNLAKNYVTLDQ